MFSTGYEISIKTIIMVRLQPVTCSPVNNHSSKVPSHGPVPMVSKSYRVHLVQYLSCQSFIGFSADGETIIALVTLKGVELEVAPP